MKKALAAVYNAALAHPLGTLAVVSVLAFLLYFTIPAAIFEWQSEKHIEQQEEFHEKVDELKVEAAADAAIGQTEAKRGAEVEKKLTKTKESISEKKAYVKKLEDTVPTTGSRPIRDDSIESDAQLCARANSLGVLCTLPTPVPRK